MKQWLNRTFRDIVSPGRAGLAAAVLLLGLNPVRAWDYPYHRLINQLALASLPTNYPIALAVPATRERLLFLSGEPDRWRNSPENTFKHANGPDHYMDLEDLELLGITPEKLPPFRHQFTALLFAARTRYAERLPAIDPTRNRDQTRELAGYLPWTVAEHYGKLKSAFACLKVFQAMGSKAETANMQENVVYVMGVMGHFVGDASQPLHTTMHFNGWVGANPQGYTTNRSFHQWIDGSYLDTVGFDATALEKQVRPAKNLRAPGVREDDLFKDIVQFMLQHHRDVEALYRLEKESHLTGQGGAGMKGRAFLAEKLLASGQMLGDLWLTAWQQANEDTFLRDQLQKRSTAGGR